MSDEGPDMLAAEAVAGVRTGMVVGLGTGRAASRGVRALAARALAERLDIRCVATSDATAELAHSLGLTVVELDDEPRVDLLFDGADELAPDLSMVKGRGGAMTRERIVARAAQRRIYLVDQSKLVDHLGEKAPWPIEILPFGAQATIRAIESIGLRGYLREASDGRPYHTDNGGLIIDVGVPAHDDLRPVMQRVDSTPGVIGHGLFLDECDEALIEIDDGSVERWVR